MLELAFRPDRASAAPVYQQLAASLREWVETGRLAVGERLPSSRELAVALGVARNTVTEAYLSLADLGFLRSHVGQGTFVAARHPVAAVRPVGAARLHSVPRVAAAPPPLPRAFAWTGLFSLATRELPIAAALRSFADRRVYPFDFRGGQVDATSFPAGVLARACARALQIHSTGIALHRDPFGWPALRESIARGLVARGIGCEPDDVAIFGGAQQALDLIGRVLLDPGDTVVLEQPGYFGAALAFRARGAHLVGVDVDAEGLHTGELARLLRTRRAKLVYTTPAVQNPTGVTLSEARRQTLLELADAHQVPVIEDDYDSELRLGGLGTPALKTRDAAGQVIYVGTFSKALFPGLRIGYVVAARPLLERLVVARFVSDFQTSPLLQAALAELLVSGALERHVRRVRRIYAGRLAALRAALSASMPNGTHVGAPAGGNGLWVRLPAGADADAIAASAQEVGVAYDRGDFFYLDGPPPPCLALSFANTTPERIADGIERLGRIVRERIPAPAQRAGRRQRRRTDE